ncbi:hypothetical protein [Streptomyces sp. NPDC047928]|uniref:hypothetical protein n=1 Tax=unclassified Streptomyces TaxID=2593676 RepID=UPI0037219CAE
MAVTMSRFTDVFRAEAAKALPGATPGELSLAAWAAWATGSFFNILAYLGLVLALAALGAVAWRQLGVPAEFRPLRQLIGAVLGGYLAVRTAGFLVLSLAGLDGRVLLEWLARPEPSLLLAAAALGLLLRRNHPGLGTVRTAVCAVLPVAVLGLLQAAL